MFRHKLKAFCNWIDNSVAEEVDLFLNSYVQENSRTTVGCLLEVESNLDYILSSWKQFNEANKKYPNFKYCTENIGYGSNFVTFYSRAEREGIWSLHLASLNEIVPYMFEYDTYARWVSIYLSDIICTTSVLRI